MSNFSSYRGRLAPSPTGLLHLGHARTFTIAAARARAAGGRLLLRNEDLDPYRARAAYAAFMMEDLRWIGVAWDEGPDVGGPWGPYAQSARLPLYRAAWGELAERGYVYPCSCSRRQLRESMQAPHESPGEGDDEPVYPGTCRPVSGANRVGAGAALFADPAGVNWRFRVPSGEAVCFEDGNYGPRRYLAGRDFGDFLIWRRDGVPAYQLAVTVDDAAMHITEVVRGADLLKSTARQLLLYRALGLEPPAWFHCTLVADAQGQRLAKRADALSLRALRAGGCSPEAAIAMAGRMAAESHPWPSLQGEPESLH